MKTGSLDEVANVEDNLFEKDEDERSDIFDAPHFLSIDYIPNQLIFRENEIDMVKNNIKKVFDGLAPSHMLIHGPPGTGKTHAVKKIKEDFNEYAKNKDVNAGMKHFSCKNKTTYQILTRIARSFDPSYPSRGLGEGEVVEDVAEFVDDEDSHYIFVFDEVDKITEKSGKGDGIGDLIYFTTRLGELIDKGVGEEPLGISVILISNKTGIRDDISEYNKSTFHPTTVYFKDYDVDQLRTIIKRRCREAFKDGVIKDDVIQTLAQKTRDSNSDLRFSFTVLRVAGELVERLNLNCIDESLLEKSFEKVNEQKINEAVKEMNETELMTLWSLMQAKKKVNGEGITSHTFYRTYENLCEKMNIDPKSHRHLTSRVTSRLESQGFITAELKGRGRGKGVNLMYRLAGKKKLKKAIEEAMSMRYDEYAVIRGSERTNLKGPWD